MFRVSEEGMLRLAEAARESKLRIDEEAQRLVDEGQSPEYYLGYVNGIAAVITLCRGLAKELGERAGVNPHRCAETIVGESIVTEVVELITMRTAVPAAVAAGRFLEAQSRSR